MKNLSVWLVILLVAVPASAAPTLKEARKRWLRGNYEEARALFEELARDPGQLPASALGLSRIAECQGRYDQALSAVDTALPAAGTNADLHARRAELLFLRGSWDDADKAVARALELRSDHFLAHWIRARLFVVRGDLTKADAEFRWFVRTYTTRNDADQDVKDPEELLLIGLAGCDNARWNNLADQFQFILNEVFGEALRQDEDFWPAKYHAGLVFLEKYDRPDALAAFDKALTLNPNAAPALVGKGVAALQRYEFQDADRFADRALRINPNLPEALRLKADVHLAAGDLAGATASLDHARRVNPRDEETLGRVAACLFLRHQNQDLRKLSAEVEARDSHPGVFYQVLAEQLDGRHRYPEAEGYYKKSAALWPMLAAARGSLGLLYMRMGREDEARPLLEKAFASDGFNVRVSNMLTVLHHLEHYQTLKTEHFLVRFDPKADGHLARYLARYLEETHTALTEKFRAAPRQPIVVEVFNSHEMFSGRVTALPDLHTVGACTGPMVALASPRAKGISRPFNWARVVRHELVHVFNLEQTHFQVPHWFTEGLAVSNEGFPRPQQWSELLRERVHGGQLLTLDTIDLAFIRPRSPIEWTLAYCQSQLYVEYMQNKYGAGAIGRMLDAFGNGLGTRAALSHACHVEPATFEQGYRTYLEEVVKPIHPRAVASARTLHELQEAHEKDPEDSDAGARLAEQFLLRRRSAEARKLAEAVLAKKPAHALASYVKARLLLDGGDEEQARAVLEATLGQGATEPRVLRALGKLYFDGRDFARAAEMFELGRKAEPYENMWLRELARTYAQAGDLDKRLAVLKDLVPADADDLDTRKDLARLLEDAGRHAEAEAFARQALEIDVLDPDAQRALADALLNQGKRPEAVDAYQVVLDLDPRADNARLGLARAYLEGGDRRRADNEITQVLTRDPDNAEARRLRALVNR
jgi:tetratricopeptide (TPR) repeat protein